jgi:adenine phosphoribosyltransferase
MSGFSRLIRDVADFPKPGILFKDIMPMLADGPAFAAAVSAMADPWRAYPPGAVAGVEARGFILGAAIARELGVGFVPVRKPGKLPGDVHELAYALEYGEDRLQVQRDALAPGTRVLLVDDVLATGGTLLAAARLLGGIGVELAGAAVLVELEALGGRARWTLPVPLQATLRY